eukprot:3203079-Pyramimonas_sp.AAC.1
MGRRGVGRGKEECDNCRFCAAPEILNQGAHCHATHVRARASRAKVGDLCALQRAQEPVPVRRGQAVKHGLRSLREVQLAAGAEAELNRHAVGGGALP